MGRVYEKWHICKCLVFHAENLVKVYTQKNSGYTKSRRKIRQQKIPKINSKFLHIEVLSREAWASKDTRFLTLSGREVVPGLFHELFRSRSNLCNPVISFLHHFCHDRCQACPVHCQTQDVVCKFSDERQGVSGLSGWRPVLPECVLQYMMQPVLY